MGSQPKPGPDGISKRMIAVVAAMLLIILVPAAVTSAPWSEIVLTITNAEPDDSVQGHFSIFGAGVGYTEFYLQPDHEQEWTFTVSAGSCTVYVSYEYPSEYWNYDYVTRSISVPFMGTEEVQISLTDSSW